MASYVFIRISEIRLVHVLVRCDYVLLIKRYVYLNAAFGVEHSSSHSRMQYITLHYAR